MKLGQDPIVCEEAYRYIMTSLPSMYFLGQFDLKKRFLNCMKITWVPMVAQSTATMVHILWCYLFVVKWDMDIVGLAIATNISTFTMLFIITVYAHCISSISDALFFPTSDSFKHWGEYLRLSIPATVMLCAEWWAFEILTILSGIIGVNEQAAQVIAFNILA